MTDTLRAALERLVAWHDRRPLEGPGPSTVEVEKWWDDWTSEELAAFDQARAALQGDADAPVGGLDVAMRSYFASRGSAIPVITTGRKAIEEAEELVEAIAEGDAAHVRQEIADLALVAAVAAAQYGTTVEACIAEKATADTGRGEPKQDHPRLAATTSSADAGTTGEACPTCGVPVRLVSSDEGTSHYAARLPAAEGSEDDPDVWRMRTVKPSAAPPEPPNEEERP